MKECRCSNCRFYDGDHCRRRAPLPRDRWSFSLIAMLQAIAIAQLNAAGLGKGDADDMVYDEVTEQYEPGKWPHVHDNDWCGEWKSDDNRFGVVHSGGLRVRADELAAKEAKLAEIRAKEKTA